MFEPTQNQQLLNNHRLLREDWKPIKVNQAESQHIKNIKQ